MTMRPMLAAAAVALTAACAAAVGVPATAGDGMGPAPSASSVQRMAARVNEYRRSVGCAPLAWMDGAAAAAQAHSDDMARRDYFGHVSPEGAGPVERLRAAGAAFRMIAENIALNPGAPREVLAGWTRSPGHDGNLRNCGYTHHGIGERSGRWTHVFVTPP